VDDGQDEIEVRAKNGKMAGVSQMNVLIIGASQKEERYSHKAMKLLWEHGHKVLLFHPKLKQILGHKVINSWSEKFPPVDTITVYVNPLVLGKMKEAVANLKPRRMIFNPGTQDEQLLAYFQDKGIQTLQACTLVMLKTDRF